MRIKYLYTKYVNKKFNKMNVSLNAREIELILKCLAIGYENFDNEKLLFNDKNNDKEKIFYLQRFLGCKANQIFNYIDNNEYFK